MHLPACLSCSAQGRGVGGGGGVSFLLQIINIKADAVRYDNGPRF